MSRRIIIALPFFILSLVLSSCSGQSGDDRRSDAYEFPVRPEMEDWKTFGTHDEMTSACQIPDSTLRTMSTKGLVETVLNYPLLVDTFAYNALQTGFDAVKSQFNGIPELLSREDAATEILAKYRSLDIAGIEGKGTSEISEYILGTVAFTEILLAQDTIIDKMDNNEQATLVSEAIQKNNIKQQFPEIYGLSGREYTTWIMSRVMRHEDFVPFIQELEKSDALKSFVASGSFASVDLLDEITSMAQEFLSRTEIT